MFGNIAPFFTNWGPASATQGGILTGGGTGVVQQLGGNKEWTNQAADKGTLAKWTPAAYLALPASTENPDINYNLARTVQFATGALATQRAALFQAPTYSFVGASTLTTAATVAITGAPVAGTNATITHKLAFWVQSGISRFDIAGGTTLGGSRVLHLRETDGSTTNRVEVGWGYQANAVNQPVITGYKASSSAGNTKGAWYIATRDVTTDTVPTERVVVDSAGNTTFSTSAQVGSSGTPLTQIKVYSQTLTPSSVAANTTAEQTFTVTGLTTADKVSLNHGAAQTAGIGIVGVRVSAANTLAITFANNTAGGLTPVSSTCLITAIAS